MKRTALEVLSRARISLLSAERIHNLIGEDAVVVDTVSSKMAGVWDDRYAEDLYEIKLKNGQRFWVRYIVVEAQ